MTETSILVPLPVILKSAKPPYDFVQYLFPIIAVLVVISGSFSLAYAHTTVQVEQYSIEVGWGIEPPVVGFRNTFVFEIAESPSEGVKTGVKNAFKNLEATVKFGGASKKLDINADPQAGHFHSPVIPTKTGSMSVLIQGEINGVPVDVDIPIEDVESTAVLDFPPTSGGSSNQDVAALKNAMSTIQKDVSEIKASIGDVSPGSNLNVGPAYDFAVLGLSMGAAGVILAIIAMLKRK